jgi:hypothetical protein
MSGLCDYRNYFGKPKTGVHKYRVANFAIVDIIMTIIGAVIISLIFRTNLLITLGILFLTGIALHRLFCVRTTVDILLFPQ